MTETEKNAIVDRYRRGQSLEFIRFATDLPLRVVRETVIAAGIRLPKRGERNRNWGFRGGYR